MYAEVAVNAPVRKTYHYEIPIELEGQLHVGHLVRVAFGTAMQPGIVLHLIDALPDEIRVKPIIERLDPTPVVNAEQIELARWLSDHYLAPIGQCLWLMLPPGLIGKYAKLVSLKQAIETEDPLQTEIIEQLTRHGPLRLKQLQASLKNPAVPRAVDRLAASGIVETQAVLAPPSVRPKQARTALLTVSPHQISGIARHLGKSSPRADILEVLAAAPDEPFAADELLRIAGTTRPNLSKLAQEGYISIEKTGRGEEDLVFLEIPAESVDEVVMVLRGGHLYNKVLLFLAEAGGAVPLSEIYQHTGASLAHLRRLEEEGLLLFGDEEITRDSLARRTYAPSYPPMLTPEQNAVWSQIQQAMKRWEWTSAAQNRPEEDEKRRSAESVFLLHGVTGSGKTEIYLRAIELALAQGRQAMFLVPEIALTGQTIRRVVSRFPGRVAVVHGSLSHGERYDTWRRARAGEIGVIVGTRSALFTPLPDVALIILDEEHDHSYKQAPPTHPPYYQSREVAEQMILRSGGILILGSATPDIAVYWRAQQGEIRYLELPNRILGHRDSIAEQEQREGLAGRYHRLSEETLTMEMPPVQVVDMREELKSGNTHMFSRALHHALEETLSKGEQAILFLNRRGQSTYVFCRDCGYVAGCERCDMPLTYHRQGEAMRCHHCGYEAPPPKICPQCGLKRIKFFGAGTQHVELELKKTFPQARGLRWDADTASKPDLHEDILKQFSQHEADVMIGTQMIAKGLDLPRVTLVGVVSADLGLALPDFRAGERIFQLLTQVAGRAGRGLLGGRVILQTYMPEHYAIQAASEHHYGHFYEREILYRRDLGYPPFRRLVRILFMHSHPIKAQQMAEQAAERLRVMLDRLQMTGTDLIGPAPCFFSRIDNDYRWHVILRGPNPTQALEAIDIPRDWQVDIDPVDML